MYFESDMNSGRPAKGTVLALQGQFVYHENYYNLQYFKSEGGGRAASRLIVRAP